MFLESPAQAAKEIQLPFGRIVPSVGAGQRIIPGFVQMRVLQRHGGRMGPQIACIQINHIAEDGLAPFFGDMGNHFAHAAVFAERVKQIFGVVTVVKPDAGGRSDHAVHDKLERAVRQHVAIDPVHLCVQCGRQGDIGAGKDHQFAKPRVKMVADGGVDLDPILDQDQADRPFCQHLTGTGQKPPEVGKSHCVPVRSAVSACHRIG